MTLEMEMIPLLVFICCNNAGKTENGRPIYGKSCRKMLQKFFPEGK
jgi:hypothetical protein